MFANFATALPAGAAMTFLLLFGMHSLIAMQPGAAVDAPRHPIQPWVYVPKNEKLNLDRFEYEEIPEVVPTPPIERTEFHSVDDPGIKVSHHAPAPGPGEDFTLNSGFSDGPLVIILRVAPTYPTSLVARGVEGHVTVIFDVLPDGSVTNIAVLDSSHSGFERSAIRAASRFKYKARVVEGVPQTSTGIRYRFTFEMDK